MNTNTPRTDAEPCNQPMLSAQSDPIELYQKLCSLSVLFEKSLDACVEYRKQLDEAEAEVEWLKELLNRAINEIEKIPFHTPKLTAFTAHRLAERYRDEITNKSTKPADNQYDDK